MSFRDLLRVTDRVLQASLLADTVRYTASDGAAADVKGMFDMAYVQVSGGEAGVASSGPAVFLRLADLPSNPGEDLEARVLAEGVVYRVREVQPDGHGGILVLLHEV
jgi:hypothetical protein